MACVGIEIFRHGIYTHARRTLEVTERHMKYTGITYRPPFEAESLLLQVTQGCSHNRCAFCTMYRDVPFRTEALDQIERDLGEARMFRPHARRVFLVNGDAFALGADMLCRIAEKIHDYLPDAETVAMYASVRNVEVKTDGELRALRAAGINDLNIGLESGLGSVLERMNKGYVPEQALRALQRLDRAGMRYGVNVILGAAGAGNGLRTAEATAGLLNQTGVSLIFTGTIHADPGCPLYDDMRSGVFTESDFAEYLLEEQHLLELLRVEDCLLFGLHPSNVVALRGYLPADRDKMLLQIEKARLRLRGHLHERPRRFGEGGIILPR